MRITPALAYEKLRQDAESQNKIILHKDGKFYHVYEWSAWLLKTLVCTEELQRERGDAKMLQVNRFTTKSGEYVLAGFPLESVSKYIPEYDDLQEMEGGDLSITITLQRRYATAIDRAVTDHVRGVEAEPARQGRSQEYPRDSCRKQPGTHTGQEWRLRYHLRSAELSGRAENSCRKYRIH